MKTLILDNINTSASLAVVRSLGVTGHIADVACPRNTVAAASRFCRNKYITPALSDERQYVEFILKILETEKYDVLFITEDSILELILAERERFENLVNCFFPQKDSLRVALSKTESMKFAESIGVAIPKTYFPAGEAELEGLSRSLSYPKVIKGEKGTAANLIRYASSSEELVSAYQEIKKIESPYKGRPIIQELVHGKEYLVHVLCNKGDVLRICCHEKVLRYPVSGGVTTLGVTVEHPELVEASIKLFEALGWHGLAKLDYIKDANDGIVKLLSIDPRVSTSIDLPRYAGINFADLLCQLAAGKVIKKDLHYKIGVKYRLIFPREILYNIARPWHIPISLLQCFDPQCYSDFQWSDFYPGLINLKHTFWYIKDHFQKGTLWTGGIKKSHTKKAE